MVELVDLTMQFVDRALPRDKAILDPLLAWPAHPNPSSGGMLPWP